MTGESISGMLELQREGQETTASTDRQTDRQNPTLPLPWGCSSEVELLPHMLKVGTPAPQTNKQTNTLQRLK
jgi:hypothetical protein